MGYTDTRHRRSFPRSKHGSMKREGGTRAVEDRVFADKRVDDISERPQCNGTEDRVQKW